MNMHVASEDLEHPSPVDLVKLVSSYKYDANDFAPLYAALNKKIRAYDPNNFGPMFVSHLKSVAYDIKNFLVLEGFNEDIALKVSDAFALHDLGKILQSPSLWHVTEQKKTSQEKLARLQHTFLGPHALSITIEEIGFIPTADQKKHIQLIEQLMLYHHERLNGKGPFEMAGDQMDKIMKIATVVDTIDGKVNKSATKALAAIFADMTGDKHGDEFDTALVARYQDYYYSRGSRVLMRESAPSVLANSSLS